MIDSVSHRLKALPGVWLKEADVLESRDGLLDKGEAWAMRECARQLSEALTPLIASDDGRAQAHEQAGWQPIETAPKDGTWVLVWGPLEAWSSVKAAWYAMNRRIGRAYWKMDGEWDDYELADNQPTHWMPLPDPPTSSQAHEQDEP